MANVKHLNVNATIDGISDYAPLVIFVMMLTMFGLTGWMQYHFLKGVLDGKIEGVGYLIFLFPIVIQILRFVTGFLSASFFKKGKWLLGALVLGFSVWLSIFEYGKVSDMATVWTALEVATEPLTHSPTTNVTITRNIIRGIMTVLIWGALVLEAFLAFWVASAMDEPEQESGDDQEQGKIGFSTSTNGKVFSTNGATKKGSRS